MSGVVKPTIAFDVRHELGEGIIWHDDLQALVWCDILGQALHIGRPDQGITAKHRFDEPVSAVFATTTRHLIVASASALWCLDPVNNERQKLIDVEANDTATRSNDGRVGPGGSIWLGTMGRSAEANAGRLYHIDSGRLSVLRDAVTIPNATCFSPDGSRAYFGDTSAQCIWTCAIDRNTAQPTGPWDVFVDLSREGLNPDGAVIDAEGYLWNAQWGAGRVARYAPDGRFDRAIDFPTAQVTCPAFGGPDRKTLFVTSAWEHMSPETRALDPLAGAIFSVELDIAGLPERRVEPWWNRDQTNP